jgi:hypothetical protein
MTEIFAKVHEYSDTMVALGGATALGVPIAHWCRKTVRHLKTISDPLTPNGGFDLIVSCSGAGQVAEGTFIIHWSRK